MNLGSALLLAEFVKQIIPVVSVLAGVTLAVAFIGSGGATDRTRTCLVLLLTASSMSFICAICAASFFLYRIGLLKASLEFMSLKPGGAGLLDLINQPDAGVLDLMNQADLDALFFVSIMSAASGMYLVIAAIGVSGFTRSLKDGIITAIFALVGGSVLIYCAAAAQSH